MDLSTYLFAPMDSLGVLDWIFLIAQIVLLVLGAYFAFIRRDNNTVRAAALGRLGYALLILGALGTLFGVLQYAAVAPFNARYWTLIIVAFEIALAIYAWFYSRTTYQEQLAAREATTRRAQRAVASGRAQPAPPSARPSAPRQTVTTAPPEAGARRYTRRERKRRKK